MTHDPQEVREACRLVGKRFSTPCVLCKNILRHSMLDTIDDQMVQHDPKCPLRIAMVSALNTGVRFLEPTPMVPRKIESEDVEPDILAVVAASSLPSSEKEQIANVIKRCERNRNTESEGA